MTKVTKLVSVLIAVLGVTNAPVAKAEDIRNAAMLDTIMFELKQDIQSDLFIAKRLINRDIVRDLSDKQRIFEVARERLTVAKPVTQVASIAKPNKVLPETVLGL
jgi:hypothetical protein